MTDPVITQPAFDLVGPAGGDLTGSFPNPTIKASVSLTTPVLGVATATSINGTLIPTTSGDTTSLLGTAQTLTQPHPLVVNMADTTSSTINGLGSASTGNITVAATTNWPTSAFAFIDDETVAYTLVDATTINVTARGVWSSTGATHGNGATVRPVMALAYQTTSGKYQAIVTANGELFAAAFGLRDNSTGKHNGFFSMFNGIATLTPGAGGFSVGPARASIGSNGVFGFTSSSNGPDQTVDTGLSRIAAGVVGAGTGAQGSTAGTFYGTIKVANAYTATPQVCTGYVTLLDSTGTTYKVLVST